MSFTGEVIECDVPQLFAVLYDSGTVLCRMLFTFAGFGCPLIMTKLRKWPRPGVLKCTGGVQRCPKTLRAHWTPLRSSAVKTQVRNQALLQSNPIVLSKGCN